MSSLVVTIDIDWASDAAIDQTLDYFANNNIPATLFSTHDSPVIDKALSVFDVGLHPFFGEGSSHGRSIPEITQHVMDLPHNFKGFRCHRFGVCNSSKAALLAAGMQISSNVCTNLEILPPFQDRFGLLEVPIFLEDGGYLWKNHPLEVTPSLALKLGEPMPKVIIIHPMHFALNSPTFDYMLNIKNTHTRHEWQTLSQSSLKQLHFTGRGIRDFIEDLIVASPRTMSLRQLCDTALKAHNPHTQLPARQNHSAPPEGIG